MRIMEGKKRGAEGGGRGGEEKALKLDLISAMSLDTLSNPFINLAAITNLDLSNNNLESIPEWLMARLVNVVVLDVHSNQLRVLPNSVGCLSKLKLLNVSGNLLHSLPTTIEDCRALEELNANFNKLARLPDTMGLELINLQKLAVNSNKLAHLPHSTSHMTSLRVLDARLNCLRSLPDGLDNLIRLQVLNVSQNFHYLHSIPPSIGGLISLVELDISYNSITSLPTTISSLTKLRRLRAEGNPLVSPPMELVDQSVDAVRDYFITAQMNGNANATQVAVARRSWFGKLFKWGPTFTGSPNRVSVSVSVSVSRGIMDESDGFLLSDYRPIHGLATPRHVGRFSPRRLFSPKRGTATVRQY